MVEAMRFFAAVRLASDDGIEEIWTVDEAVDFLRRWPATRRGTIYDCALRGLDACRGGDFPVEDARRGFESFARITGILRAGGPVLPTAGRQAGLPAARG